MAGPAAHFVLGVDLDGVVADFARGLKPIAAEWLGVAESTLTDDISYGFGEWGLDAVGGYDALHRFAVKERELFARLPPIAGAPAALRRLELKRAIDRWSAIATTDFLARSFTWRAPGIAALRSAGLGLLGLVTPVRTRLARQMMFGLR